MAKLGVNIPNYGSGPVHPGLEVMALAAEAAGVDRLHLSDHLAFVDGATSRYPFSPDGVLKLDATNNIFESMASSAWILSATERIHVGPSIMVLTQRHPLEVAKAAATIDSLSGGRFFLGVGAGWLAEETKALGYEWSNRGARLEEAIDILRLAWSGTGEGYEGEQYHFPAGVHSRPLPARPGGIPLYVGGMSKAALERAARKGDGWVAALYPYEFESLKEQMAFLDKQLAANGRSRSDFMVILRLLNDADTSGKDIPGLAAEAAGFGVDEIVVDPGWEGSGGLRPPTDGGGDPDVDAAVEILLSCVNELSAG